MGLISDLFVKLSLKKDEYDKGLNDAQKQTSNFGAQISKIGGIIAGAFAVGAIVSFIKSAVAGYNEVAQANAKLKAVLKATDEQAGMTYTSIKATVEELKNTTLFSGTSLTDASAVLLTFRQVSKGVFSQTMKSAADLATVMGTDLHGAVMQLGKALATPTMGLTALRRAGVTFTDEQTNMIKTLASTGHLLEAQQMILKEVATEFGGAAQAAADAGTGPLQMFQKRIGAIKKSIGETIVESKLWKDAIEKLGTAFDGLNNIMHGMKSTANSSEVESVVEAVMGGKPENWQEAKAYLKKQIEDNKALIQDYKNSLEKENTGINKVLALNPLSGASKRIESLKREINLYEQANKELEKIESKIKEPAKKENYTIAKQIEEARKVLVQTIADAKEAARTADLGQPFIEASKAVAEAQKALEEFDKTYQNTARGTNLSAITGKVGAFGSKPGSSTQHTGGEMGAYYPIGDKIELPGLAPLDAWANEISKRLWEAEDDWISPVEQFNMDFTNIINAGLQDAAMAIGEGFGNLASKEGGWADFGKGMLSAVANFMAQFGKLLIAFGVAKLGLETAIKTPGGALLAIGAGIALVAASKAISNWSNKGISGVTSGGGNYSASGYTGPTNDMRSQSDNKVVFEIQGTKLVGVLANTAANKRITG